jgi:cbb3-type cytochrome oxidase maturation protein
MNGLLLLIPIALALGLGGLATFLWALGAGQFDDLEGAGGRILFDEDDEQAPPPSSSPAHSRRAP